MPWFFMKTIMGSVVRKKIVYAKRILPLKLHKTKTPGIKKTVHTHVILKLLGSIIIFYTTPHDQLTYQPLDYTQ